MRTSACWSSSSSRGSKIGPSTCVPASLQASTWPLAGRTAWTGRSGRSPGISSMRAVLSRARARLPVRAPFLRARHARDAQWANGIPRAQFRSRRFPRSLRAHQGRGRRRPRPAPVAETGRADVHLRPQLRKSFGWSSHRLEIPGFRAVAGCATMGPPAREAFTEHLSWLNAMRDAEYQEIFSRYFDIEQWIPSGREGAGLLTTEFRRELSEILRRGTSDQGDHHDCRPRRERPAPRRGPPDMKRDTRKPHEWRSSRGRRGRAGRKARLRPGAHPLFPWISRGTKGASSSSARWACSPRRARAPIRQDARGARQAARCARCVAGVQRASRHVNGDRLF